MSLKVFIADDHGIIRDGIRALLYSESDIEVIGVAENGRQAIELITKLNPDVVLMDVSMPELNGIDATRQLMKEFPTLRILALSTYSDHRYVSEMLHAGAAGYILKDGVFDELLFAIRSIQRGQSYLSPPIAHLVLSDYRQGTTKSNINIAKSEDAKKTILTKREREVLQLLAEGHTMKDIAHALFISIKTVETHRKKISDKLGIRSIIDLTKYAIREGITSVYK